MGMLRKLRDKLDGFARPAAAGDDTSPGHFAFSAEIPAGSRGPVCRVDVQLLRQPQHDGERLRLRAHLQTNFASVLRPALQRRGTQADARVVESSAARALAPLPQRAARFAGRGLQRALNTRLARRVYEPLLQHDVNTWVELQASTEPLDDGAHELVPQQEALARLGIRPSKLKGPVAESWSGQTGSGYAQLSLLQIEKRDLPEELQRRLGGLPFQLAAAIVNTVERK